MKKLFKRFNDEEFRFVLATGLKVAAIFLFLLFLSSYLIWLLISMNTVFIEANAEMAIAGVQSTYKDYIISNSLDNIPYVCGFLVMLFLGGIYLAKMLLRPFKVIEKYCDDRVNGEKSDYSPDFFSEYKLLTRFSEFFFQYLDEVEKDKFLKKSTIPPQYTKIHSAPFDRVFFFHFVLIITIIAICNFIFINILVNDLQEGILSLVLNLLKDKENISLIFIKQQEVIFNSINVFLSIILVVYYLILSFHLYSKVSGAVFGFFSTMRAFMKGNHEARVHLLGYNHIRATGRSFNKYLKYICDAHVEKKDS